jgi:exodeoxyribonuclease VII large subunit
MYTLSVSALNEQIKGLLETSFERVFVEGEISRITFHNSGHIYFTLKDSASSLSAVMFRGNASKLKFRLEEGMKVVIDGAITLYKPRGAYQINCFGIEPSGQGALALAYEQLKQKLSAQGYFETHKKKPLPKFPHSIAFITSATGAALQDMLHVANARYKLLEIDIYDVLVQGENAAPQIAQALQVADTKGYDILIVARGGGSIEDLWAFNEECVADAIYDAQTPVVSAVGHEIDWLISDFVADVRAATPSAAMEILLPDTNELLLTLDSLSSQLTQQIEQKITTKKQMLEHLQESLVQHSSQKKMEQKQLEIESLREQFSSAIEFKVHNATKEIDQIRQRFPQVIDSLINLARNQLLHLEKMLESNHPKLKTKKGFAQISQNAHVIDISELEVDALFEAQSESVVIRAKVIQKENIL